jgi:flagellar hook-basal body complex protein FliE
MSPVGGPSGAASIQQILAMRQELVDRSQLLRELHQPAESAPAAQNGPAGNFTEALKGALDGVNSAQTRASALSEGYERGEVTDVAKVMLARQEAGVAFEATLQVRNRLLSAYQDIMRMGV